MDTQSIAFTPVETEVLTHRLEILSEEETCEELFDDEADVDPEQAAAYAERMQAQIAAGNHVLPLDVPCALKVLAEALEGCTLLEMAKEAVEDGEITSQKRSSLTRGRNSAARKIEKLLGRPLRLD